MSQVSPRALLLVASKNDLKAKRFGLFSSILSRMSHARKAFTGEQYYQVYFWDSPNPTAHVAGDGEFIDINPQFANLLGYSTAEMLGRRWQEFTHPEDINSDERGAVLVLKGDIPSYTMIKRYRHKLGHYVSAQLTVSRISTEEGEFEHFVSFASPSPKLSQLKEKLEDGEVKLRPSITLWQLLVDNPTGFFWLLGLLITLSAIGGHLGTVLEILGKYLGVN